jgi:hypothetical protein
MLPVNASMRAHPLRPGNDLPILLPGLSTHKDEMTVFFFIRCNEYVIFVIVFSLFCLAVILMT